MKKIHVWGFCAAAFCALAASSAALDIPLGGGSAEGGGGGRIGFVDMDRIFEIYPQTEAARQDYLKQLKKKKDQLAEKEAQLNEVKNKIAVLEQTVKGMPAPNDTAVAGSSPTAEGVPADSLASMKADLESKKAEYEDLKKQASKDLATFQSQQSQLILGKIYQALRDLAIDEQVTVVVDKSAILYGDAAIDLTDKLQQRVRGF
jgi:Skp family chaperone for outer membrane proteins